MNEREKLTMLEEMMELEEGTLTSQTRLSDLVDWDSLTVLSFMVLMDEEFNKVIQGSQIAEFETIGDALAVMEAESGKKAV